MSESSGEAHDQPVPPEEEESGIAPDGSPTSHEHRQVLLTTHKRIIERSIGHAIASTCGLSFVERTGLHATNEIRTSKYTILTFLPINLFEQFTRVANLYFLLTAGLQLIPGLSPTSWFTTVFPLVVVLAINAIKEAADDLHRHRNDDEINNRTVLVLSQGGTETPTKWQDVRCGDLVKVLQDQEVPADLVFLSSSDEGNLCHVETANLDGETNLKYKYCFSKTAGTHTADQLVDFEERLAVQCELPNPRLYNFDGAVVDRLDPSAQQQPLTVDNLLLRGCTLRKTSWVIGLVVFSGADTKIMMNRTRPKRKVTQLERHMNILVMIMFGAMLLISILLAIGDQIFQSVHDGEWYLQIQNKWPDLGQNFGGWIIQVIRFIILLNGMIPISLYVSLEMVKVLQCFAILNTDRQMYYKETDTPFSCRTTTLNEDLGQVQYVLSDKTGTLTQNVMGFVWASIGGTIYGKPPPVNGLPQPPHKPPIHIPAKTPHSLVLDPQLHAKLGAPFVNLATGAAGGRQALGPSSDPDAAVSQFFINLAVCNTVVPQVLEDGRFVYQAASPDEEALVEGAAYAGYRLEARTTDRVEVTYHEQRWVYQVLVVLEFNSDRKRMSIICRCPDGKIRLFCKGADTMIMTRVRPGQQYTTAVRAHLEEMAGAGYRTLCVAQKELTEVSWNNWYKQYHDASVALEGREDKIHAAAERIEVDMDLLGATAVEDKLQDGVPDAIDAMVQAGIKVWVLTGDKLETAISIALSCKLFTDDMALVEVRERDFETAATSAGVQRAANRFDSTQVGDNDEILECESKVWIQKLEEVEAENIRLEYEANMAAGVEQSNRLTLTRTNKPGGANGAHPSMVGLVIEGGALAIGLLPEHQDRFIELCRQCKSVVCCRVSPMQKAAVTRLVQKKCNAITLGIGDGANDVGMIQAAHIGCGISGREGRAAVLASDFAFAQFKYVARLILIHGRSAYKRNTEVVLYSFYKNWVHNMTYVYFAFLTAFSAQPLYTTGLIATFNMFWASLPIIIFAFTEQDVSHKTLKEWPRLYADTMTADRRSFLWAQLRWIGIATWHSLVVFFVPVYSMWVPDNRGRTEDWVMVGCTVYTATVILVNLKISMRTRYWTWLNHLVVWVPPLLWFPFLALYGLVWPVAQVDGTAEMNSIAQLLFASPRFWLAGLLLAPALGLLLDITLVAFKKHLAPEPHEILQEAEYEEEVRQQALRELGVGKGMSARQTGGGAAAAVTARNHAAIPPELHAEMEDTTTAVVHVPASPMNAMNVQGGAPPHVAGNGMGNGGGGAGQQMGAYRWGAV